MPEDADEGARQVGCVVEPDREGDGVELRAVLLEELAAGVDPDPSQIAGERDADRPVEAAGQVVRGDTQPIGQQRQAEVSVVGGDRVDDGGGSLVAPRSAGRGLGQGAANELEQRGEPKRIFESKAALVKVAARPATMLALQPMSASAGMGCRGGATRGRGLICSAPATAPSRISTSNGFVT
jgi:hypothetical protein